MSTGETPSADIAPPTDKDEPRAQIASNQSTLFIEIYYSLAIGTILGAALDTIPKSGGLSFLERVPTLLYCERGVSTQKQGTV